MKNVLVLVLSCETPPYDKLMHTSLNTWESKKVEGVETIFYCGKSRKNNTDKVIYLNTPDSFATMGQKTLEAFEWALHNKNFSYLARPNASCYVRKDKLYTYAQGLPENNLYIGLKTQSCYNIEYMWGGGAYILSRDVVEKIVQHKHLWNHTYTEDVSISDLLIKLSVPLLGEGYACALHKNPDGYVCITYEASKGGGINFTDMNDMHQLTNQFFIRVKQDGQRDVDIEIMKELYRVGI